MPQHCPAAAAAVRPEAEAEVRPLRVCALVPAHNEEEQIAAAIESLLGQTHPPERIVIVTDNCTDATAEVAARYPVEVVPTRGNLDRKAGALNQVMTALLETWDPHDAVLVMDADSVLAPRFIETAAARMTDGTAAAVSGTFGGKPGGGFVGMLQRNEYARYARDLRRRRGRTLVLTGTATLFRTQVLLDVVQARKDRRLPGEPQVYDTQVLTEDNELTLAVRHLGHAIIAPPECTLLTEVMPTWSDLFRQRLRWKRGALENLFDYGWTPVTREYWLRQALSLLGLLAMTAYLATLVYSCTLGTLRLQPLWLWVTVLFMVERVVTVRARGPAVMALAAVLVVEMTFDFFLQAAQARAFWDTFRKTERNW